MRRPLGYATVIIVLAILAPLPTEEETGGPVPTYVGAKKCKVCHLEVFGSWERTKHARALASLKGEAGENPACLECHTTGFRRGGYGTEGSLGDFAGVQCEACHGAGSLYSRSSVMRQPELSKALGLARVDSVTCISCHNSKSPTFEGFAFEAGLLAGTHSRRHDKRD